MPAPRFSWIRYPHLKFHFHLLKFRTRTHRATTFQFISFLIVLFFLALYPGHNYYQTLVIRPTISPTSPAFNPATPLSAYPRLLSESSLPASVSASAVYIFDPDSGTVVYEKNPRLSLMPASTTKIMTALVALKTYNPSDVLTIKTAGSAIGSSAHLLKGDTLTVESLLYALLVSSGNDAALALAENYPDGGYPGFIAAMNDLAKTLHMEDTHYTNVSGIESSDHKTTVRDLALLTKEAAKMPLLLKIVATKSTSISNTADTRHYPLNSTNELLGQIPGLLGFKTGWTENAGECLVSLVDRDGKRIIIAILNSSDRFGETRTLIDWVYTSHSWIRS